MQSIIKKMQCRLRAVNTHAVGDRRNHGDGRERGKGRAQMLPHNAENACFEVMLVAVERQREQGGGGACDLESGADEEEPG